MSNDGAPLVGLVGPAGAGKDTVAARLVERHGFARVAFADRLRAFVERIDPLFCALITAEGGYEPAKRAHPYIRNRLVEVGQAAREIIHRNTWLDVVVDDIDALDPDVPVVVSDVRFANEADWVEEYGGTLVAVHRPGCFADTDEAARLYGRAELFVENDGDLHQLHERVDMVAEDFLL